MRTLLFLTAMAISSMAHAEPAHNLVLITVDGIRWQEVFRGIDKRLIDDERYTRHPEQLTEDYHRQSANEARELLFPFLWSTVDQRGVLLGNRDIESRMQLTNQWYFSFPGYNEILAGRADPSIDSNKTRPNPNVTFLEWLHRKPEFDQRVHAFGSWNVFPYIINEERSGIPVNAGFEPATGDLSKKQEWLNELQEDIPSPWHNVRLDAFTHHYALETLRQEKPRLLYIAYGETDDFAHDGEYDQYIHAAHRFDRFVKEIWDHLQATEGYKDNTVLMIATDHGRGELPLAGWQHHGSMRAFKSYLNSPAMKQFRDGIEGAEDTWMAAMGPGISPLSEKGTQGDWYNNQLAATALTLLGFDWREFDPKAGEPIDTIIETGESQ